MTQKKPHYGGLDSRIKTSQVGTEHRQRYWKMLHKIQAEEAVLKSLKISPYQIDAGVADEILKSEAGCSRKPHSE